MIKKYVFLLLLLTASVLGNVFSFELFFGVDFLFGSVIVFFIYSLYGIKWGIASVVLSASYTVVLWNHPYAIIIFLIEFVFVVWINRRKQINFIIGDYLYWLFIGIPLVYLFYMQFLQVEFIDATIVALKDALNGIFNTLLFTSIYYVYDRYIVKSQVKIEFRSYLFVILTAVFLFPSFGLLVYEGKSQYNQTIHRLEGNMREEQVVIEKYLKQWVQDQEETLNNLGERKDSLDRKSIEDFLAISPSMVGIQFKDDSGNEELITYQTHLANEIKSNLRNQSANTKINLYQLENGNYYTNIIIPLKDEAGYVEGIYNVSDLTLYINEHFLSKAQNLNILSRNNIFYHRYGFNVNTPSDFHKSKVTILKQASLTYVIKNEKLGWDYVLTVPIKPYQEEMYRQYSVILLGLLLLSGIFLTLSYYLSGYIVSSIINLSKITEKFSKSVFDQEDIVWPNTSIKEISILTDNFKAMLAKIQYMMDELKHQHEELEFLALHDSLTKMNNRFAFYQKLETALEHAKNKEQNLAILFCDLDRFKHINDTLGHDVGDELLVSVAEIARDVLPKDAILCRYGGDEFIFAIPNIKDNKEIEEHCREFLFALSQPIEIKNHSVNITSSIGVSMYPNHSRSCEALISKADMAMYSAKEKGKNTFEFYHPRD